MEKTYKNLKEITPKKMRCDSCTTCPALFEVDKRKVLVVGKRINPKDAGLGHKVGKDEAIIEVDRGLLEKP